MRNLHFDIDLEISGLEASEVDALRAMIIARVHDLTSEIVEDERGLELDDILVE